MSISNREVALAWFEQVWNAGDEAQIDRLMAPGARFHGLPSADAEPIVGPAAFKPLFRAFRQAFPDMRIELLHIACEGRFVATHCLVTGSHTGSGPGPEVLVQCATLFCTYPAAAARPAFARVTLARMSEARAVQMNGLGSML